MKRRNLWIVVVLIAAGLPLTACEQSLRASPDTPQTIAPAMVERIEGTDLSRVTLTAKAAKRLDIKTAPVREAKVTRSGNATLRKVVPYAAVLYGSNSGAWVYTTPRPLVYVRHRIAIDYINGDEAVLSDGPPAGTAVVTVGAAELFGTEFEIRR